MSPTDLAKAMYLSYGETTEFKNYQGNPMPDWKDLTPKIQGAWEAAACRAIGYMIVEQQYEDNRLQDEWDAKFKFDEREMAQIEHAQDYASNHSKAGAPGHGQFLLIAKLANALEL